MTGPCGDSFLSEHGDPIFTRRCSGGSAGINSAAFFTCLTCGAAVVEMEHGTGPDGARRIHVQWHREQKNGSSVPTASSESARSRPDNPAPNQAQDPAAPRVTRETGPGRNGAGSGPDVGRISSGPEEAA